MNAWWANRTARERLLLALGAGLIGFFALAQATLVPLIKWRSGAAARADAAEARYQLVARSAAIATPVKAASAEPVRNVLNALAAALDIELTFVNALPDGSVELQAGPAAPDRLFDLFLRLEREHGVKVVSADLSRSSEDADLVRAQATLAR
jgi:type II secretory pathway component PulM